MLSASTGQSDLVVDRTLPSQPSTKPDSGFSNANSLNSAVTSDRHPLYGGTDDSHVNSAAAALSATQNEQYADDDTDSDVNVVTSAHDLAHSYSGSLQSKKSHATLYTDIEDIEQIFLPRSIAHAQADVML